MSIVLGISVKISGIIELMWASADAMLSLCSILSTLNSFDMKSIVKCGFRKSLNFVSFCRIDVVQFNSVDDGDDEDGVGILQFSAVVSIFFFFEV